MPSIDMACQRSRRLFERSTEAGVHRCGLTAFMLPSEKSSASLLCALIEPALATIFKR